MKIILSIFTILTMIIGFSFTIIAFYTDSNKIPHLYNGGYYYLVSSIILLIIAILYTNYSFSKWVTIFIDILYIVYAFSALIFSLISLYDMPFGYFNAIASAMFVVSMILMYLGIILLNWKISYKNYLALFWIPLIGSMILVAGISTLILIFNSPDMVSHTLYASIIYFITAVVLLVFTFLISIYRNKVILYSIVLLSVIYLWIGIKTSYAAYISLSNDISIFIILTGISMVLVNIILNIKSILKK